MYNGLVVDIRGAFQNKEFRKKVYNVGETIGRY